MDSSSAPRSDNRGDRHPDYEADRTELINAHNDLTANITNTSALAERRRQAILRMRVEHGESNYQVAKHIGVTPSSVYKACPMPDDVAARRRDTSSEEIQ